MKRLVGVGKGRKFQHLKFIVFFSFLKIVASNFVGFGEKIFFFNPKCLLFFQNNFPSMSRIIIEILRR